MNLISKRSLVSLASAMVFSILVSIVSLPCLFILKDKDDWDTGFFVPLPVETDVSDAVLPSEVPGSWKYNGEGKERLVLSSCRRRSGWAFSDSRRIWYDPLDSTASEAIYATEQWAGFPFFSYKLMHISSRYGKGTNDVEKYHNGSRPLYLGMIANIAFYFVFFFVFFHSLWRLLPSSDIVIAEVVE